MLASKFRGCMIGALLGDCLGAPFEGDMRVSNRLLKNYFDGILNGTSNQIFPYTDDTAMTMSVAASLTVKGKLDVTDMAKRFVDQFYAQPRRGYGYNVTDVFVALKESEFKDVYLPAKLQFDGSGSYGNGAAMRIAPLALFAHNKGEEYLIKSARESALITHSHKNGVNGAILQCLAVYGALQLSVTQNLDPVSYINNLEEKMENIETKGMENPYCESLKRMKNIYLKNQEDISAAEIANYLGNGVAAHQSVPTAIYSFLRGFRPLNEYECSNPLLRTLYFAISVGGDTDTIASMATSIAGAYHGVESIPDLLQKRCEIINEVIELADDLFRVSQTTNKS